MIRELQDLGLSEKEAKVYLAALEIGRATADQLAKQAKIVRPTAYVQIKSLMEKGLMSTYEKGKKTYFAPESPEALRRVLDQEKERVHTQENELTRLLPDLARMFEGAGERPVVRFFEGKEGITAMRQETLNLSEDEEIRLIYSLDELATVYTLPELAAYTSQRAEKRIRVRSIYTKRGGPLPKGDITPLSERRYITPERMPLRSDFLMYRDKVGIMALSGKIFGVSIESKEIAESFRSLFDLIWETGEDC